MEKAIFFETKEIDKNTYQVFKMFAKKILKQKNYLSNLIINNTQVSFCPSNTKQANIITTNLLDMLFFHNYSNSSFIQATKNFNVFNIDSTSYQQLCRQIRTIYKQRFENIKYRKNKQDSDDINEIKKFLYEHPKETEEEYQEMLEYIIFNYSQNNNAYSKTFFQDCLNELQNVFNDIHTLHTNYLNKLKPCVFKSLTFETVNVLTQPSNQTNLISSLNLINNHMVNMTIVLPNINKYNLTLKYKKEYHGDLCEFKHNVRNRKTKAGLVPGQVTICYKMKFLHKKIRIILTKEFPKEKTYNHKLNKKAIGIDVNTKHNYMQLSDGYEIKYEEKIIKKEKNLRYYLRKRDYNISKNRNQNTTHGKKIKAREEKQARRREQHLNRKANELLKYCKEQQIKRVVMEDLQVNIRTPRKLKGRDFLQNHKQIALLLNDIKNVVKRILNKEGIEVDYVNARYTSRTCPICGHIDKNNRQQQEVFLCTECGYTINADINAAKNILARVTEENLRNELEYYDKKLKMYKGKNYKSVEKYREVYKTYLSLKKDIGSTSMSA